MIAHQIYIFAVSIAGGVAAALLYDILRVRRRNFRSGAILLHIEDFIYWILASVILIVAAYISNDGEIRGFIILGYVLGIIIYETLFSRIILNSLSFIVGMIVNGFRIVFFILAFPFVSAARLIFGIMAKIGLPVGKAAAFLSKTVSGMKTWITIRRKIINNMKTYI